MALSLLILVINFSMIIITTILLYSFIKMYPINKAKMKEVSQNEIYFNKGIFVTLLFLGFVTIPLLFFGTFGATMYFVSIDKYGQFNLMFLYINIGLFVINIFYIVLYNLTRRQVYFFIHNDHVHFSLSKIPLENIREINFNKKKTYFYLNYIYSGNQKRKIKFFTTKKMYKHIVNTFPKKNIIIHRYTRP